MITKLNDKLDNMERDVKKLAISITKIQTALGNGADETLWRSGEHWADAVCRIIEEYKNEHNL